MRKSIAGDLRAGAAALVNERIESRDDALEHIFIALAEAEDQAHGSLLKNKLRRRRRFDDLLERLCAQAEDRSESCH